jgi:hypothetical protein
VVAHFPTGEEFLLDASIRNPLALRYATAAFSTAGFAADSGEKDKLARYPTTQGKSVIPCVVESFGRIGPHFLALIDRTVLLAQAYQADLSGAARNLKDDLLVDLSATINKIIAKNYACSAAGAAHSHAPPSALIRPTVPSRDMRFHSSPLTATRHNFTSPAPPPPHPNAWPAPHLIPTRIPVPSGLALAPDDDDFPITEQASPCSVASVSANHSAATLSPLLSPLPSPCSSLRPSPLSSPHVSPSLREEPP